MMLRKKENRMCVKVRKGTALSYEGLQGSHGEGKFHGKCDQNWDWRASKMAQWGKVLSVSPNELSVVSWTHMVEREPIFLTSTFLHTIINK